MSIATKTRVSKPILSQWIVEGTVAFVAAVLLGWLLLWFQWQQPSSAVVWAAPVRGFDVPYLGADSRALARPSDDAGDEPTSLAALGTKLDGVLVQKPDVVVVSAPRVADAADDLIPMIETIARSARRDLLVVLDLAQVDSDRELGVFGNAPQRRLVEEVGQIKRREGAVNVVVMFACAPGQTSWMLDGRGRSVFSYFLQKGLEGEAREPNSPLTPSRLHAYVLANVREWVKVHRDGAVQTPLLRSVGGSLDTFKIRGVKEARIEPVAEITAPVVPAARGDAAAAPVVQVDWWEAKLKELVAEWEWHETLKAREPAPYRDAPAAWRLYQVQLLQAERLLRAARNDPSLRQGAVDLLKIAADLRKDTLQPALDERKRQEERFRFRPAMADPRSKKVLNDSLKYITGRGLDELAGLPAEPAPTPKPAPAPNSPAAGPREANVAGADDPMPRELSDAADAIPETILELQLPAWALKFSRTFDVKPFKDPRRGKQLRDAVEYRCDGETALATDRRGLSWITALIRDGDANRRAVQDGLFADPGTSDATDPKIASYRDTYRAALGQIKAYNKARSLYERLAAELPFYGEWLVLEDVRSTTAPGDPVPAELTEAIEATASLGLALEEGESEVEAVRLDAPRRLAKAADKAEVVSLGLESRYKDHARDLVAKGSDVSWRTLDDALRTPLISPADRKSLLRLVTAKETGTPDALRVSGKGQDQPPASQWVDPGYRRKAVALAWLDVKLRRLATGDLAPEEPAGEPSRLEKTLTELAAKPDPTADDFKDLTGRVRMARAALQARRPRDADVKKLGDAKLAALLRRLDRDGRFRTAAELHLQSGAERDGATRELDAYSRRAALLFHAERLALDYAVGVDALVGEAVALYADPPEPSVALFHGWLQPEVAGPVAIPETSRVAELRVMVAAREKVPEGRAFVGVEAEKPALGVTLVRESRRGAVPGLTGGLVGVTSKETEPIVFRVEQLLTVPDKTDRHVWAQVFYRGRVEEQARTEVAVKTCDFGPTLSVTIAQDRDALRRRFPEAIVEDVSDQFVEHAGKGFLHQGGRLDYVVKFQNRTPKPQTIHIERTLGSEEKGSPPPDPEVWERELGPSGNKDNTDTYLIRGTVSHRDVPLDKPKVLSIKVTNSRKEELCKPLRIELMQLHLEDYMNFQSGTKLGNVDNDGRQERVLFVTVTRKDDDPVTDPILIRDMQFSFDKKPSTRHVDEKGHMARGSRGLEQTVRSFPEDTVVPWEVVIEGVPHRGEIVVRKPSEVPK